MINTTSSFSLLEIFQMGGPLMWPLLLFSIAAVSITIERAIYIFYHDLKLSDLKAVVEEALADGNVEEAIPFLESLTKRRMGARILLALVKRHNLSEHKLEKVVETEAMSCVSSLESGFSFLIALGSIAPLTGFLGTTTGMITAFKSIAEAVDVNAQIVASGIYEALVTTVFGLIIAIVAMAAHSIFTNKVDKFTSEVEVVCSDLIFSITEAAAEAVTESAK